MGPTTAGYVPSGGQPDSRERLSSHAALARGEDPASGTGRPVRVTDLRLYRHAVAVPRDDAGCWTRAVVQVTGDRCATPRWHGCEPGDSERNFRHPARLAFAEFGDFRFSESGVLARTFGTVIVPAVRKVQDFESPCSSTRCRWRPLTI